MTFSPQQIQSAQNLAQQVETTWQADLRALGLSDWDVEITACGTAEGDFAYRLDCIYLEQITSYVPNKGTGRVMMRRLLEITDRLGLCVVLEAASQKFDERHPWWKTRLSAESLAQQAFRFEVLDQDALVAWYQRLGFVLVEGYETLMVRTPLS